MSREQWGHGYYQGYDRGVQDALNGTVGISETGRRRWFLLYLLGRGKVTESMARGCAKGYTTVHEFRLQLIVSGFSEKAAEKITKDLYDWVAAEQPLGCYITGNPWDKWTEDAFEVSGSWDAIEGGYWDEVAPITIEEFANGEKKE